MWTVNSDNFCQRCYSSSTVELKIELQRLKDKPERRPITLISFSKFALAKKGTGKAREYRAHKCDWLIQLKIAAGPESIAATLTMPDRMHSRP